MKKIKCLLTALVVLACSNFAFAQSLFGVQQVPQVFADQPFTKGVNLDQWLEPYAPCRSGVTFFGKQDIVNIKNMGANVVRIPIHFETWISDNNYTLDPMIFEYLDNIAAWSQEIQIYTILDFHRDDRIPTTAETEKVLSRVWSQVAGHYKKASPYLVYEILNEPYDIDYKLWGEIQGRIIKVIRSVDTTHKIIVNGADHSSISSMLMLPEYDDFNIILGFHCYDPYVFTHQGYDEADLPNLKHLPFPYDASRMPEIYSDATPTERKLYDTYEHEANEYTITTQIDRAIAMANERRLPLICTEFGANARFSDAKDRQAYYKKMCMIFDSRRIGKIAWSYTGDFGIFKFPSENVYPRDLDTAITKSLGFEAPNYRIATWLEDAKRLNDYSIYNGHFAQKVKVIVAMGNNESTTNLFKRDPKNGETCIDTPKMDKYNLLKFYFSKPCDFTTILSKNPSIQLYVKTSEQNLKLQLWFENSGVTDFPWRSTAYINSQDVPGDGAWHKVKIPFSYFLDNGCYDEVKKTWIRGQNKFLWNDILLLAIQNEGSNITKGLTIKDIQLVFD